MSRWTHPSVDLSPASVDVGGHESPVTFTWRLGTYVARIAMPDGTTLIGPAKATKAEARNWAWWQANGMHLGPPAA